LVYSDKVTVFFEETNSNHVNHLKQIFDWCHIYGISLNHKKYIFELDGGIMVGCIVWKYGIMIELERI
jgi:hypothetical protein